MTDKSIRLNTLIKALGITMRFFSSSIGIAPTNLIKMLKGGRPITDKTLNRIAVAFPQINIGWLKTGEGEMLLSATFQRRVDFQSEVKLQATDLSKLIDSLVSALDEQSALTRKAMAQTDKAMENTARLIVEIKALREQRDYLISTMGKYSYN